MLVMKSEFESVLKKVSLFRANAICVGELDAFMEVAD